MYIAMLQVTQNSSWVVCVAVLPLTSSGQPQVQGARRYSVHTAAVCIKNVLHHGLHTLACWRGSKAAILCAQRASGHLHGACYGGGHKPESALADPGHWNVGLP